MVDASAVVEVLRRSELGDAVAGAMRSAALATPAHLDAEVLSALARLVGGGAAAAASVDRALVELGRFPVERYPITPLLERAWALRDNVAARDAIYVACAELLGATLLTLDHKLARSSPVDVEHLP
ncbi:type II toxin-antitoxin system VapC family toxin [Egibacter rhizosphaerae]|uniref:type II toxin-antitoxin system VapC family toxin n=1 Tax=Egibacter rhizosphaerae TaxID=1670831 RepID=UPI0013F14C09|nr:type II toxin-antitoxin system VapC family toxin [Egibacter rhizosphaerae]